MQWPTPGHLHLRKNPVSLPRLLRPFQWELHKAPSPPLGDKTWGGHTDREFLKEHKCVWETDFETGKMLGTLLMSWLSCWCLTLLTFWGADVLCCSCSWGCCYLMFADVLSLWCIRSCVCVADVFEVVLTYSRRPAVQTVAVYRGGGVVTEVHHKRRRCVCGLGNIWLAGWGMWLVLTGVVLGGAWWNTILRQELLQVHVVQLEVVAIIWQHLVPECGAQKGRLRGALLLVQLLLLLTLFTEGYRSERAERNQSIIANKQGKCRTS